MEQNDNQYTKVDRRKMFFVISAICIILAAFILVLYLFANRTKASTGDGEAIRITPQRIEQISDEVGERVLQTLCGDILTDMIGSSVSKELSKEKIYEVLSEGEVEVIAIGEDQLRELVAGLLEELGISGDAVFTDDQKKYIKLAVSKALQDSLVDINILQLLSEDDKKQLTEQLRKELAETLNSQIQNSTYQLTDKELAKIKNSLNLESLISSMVNQVTKQQLEKLQSNIIENVKKSVKTPVKGKDYFTESDIKSIQKKVLKEANKEMVKQIEKITAKINEVKTSVHTLTTQIKELKTLDQEKTADIEKLQNSVTEINLSIQHINTVTKQLADAVSVSGNHLEKVTGTGSEIYSEKVNASSLTIAEFVDVLAGNDQVYTGAIQELNKIVKQLKDENAKQDKEFDESLKQLEHSLDDNGKELEDIREAFEQSDQEIKKQLEEQMSSLHKKLDAEQAAREEEDGKLQEQADAAKELIGDQKDAEHAEGNTIFQKIGAIAKVLSEDGIGGLLKVLQNIGEAKTVGEGLENLHTGVLDAENRIGELEKEKWISDITLLAGGQQEAAGKYYSYQESGSAYVYQIPLVTENDKIDLSADDTSIVVEFQQPGRLPSNVALSTSGNTLLIAFANRPTRNIKITSIHVYKEKQEEHSYE